MVVGPWLDTSGPAGQITVIASPSGSRPGAALVRSVLVDGARVVLADIDRDPAWQLLDDRLFFDGRSESASFRLHGSHVLVALAHAPQG